jgi:hypothetical protein
MEAQGNFLTQPSFGSQFVLGILSLFVVFILYLSFETIYKYYLQLSSAKVSLYPYTVSATKTITIPQDPKNPKAKTAFPSENEITGIEFSYSCFLYVQEATIDAGSATEMKLKTVFHKGYKTPWPLCGPGVFILNNKNTMRVVMNSYKKWYNKVDIEGIPINKWFHLALVCRNSTLDIYLNGNLTSKLSFDGSVPYQNYQDIVLFSYGKTTPETDFIGGKRDIPSDDQFKVDGPMTGYISNLSYYRYAIGFSEIQAEMAAGPSDKFESGSMDKPPYLIDSWWTNRSF